MALPVSDGHKTYVSNGDVGGIVRATDDPDGSNMQGLDGDDSLRIPTRSST